jgi:hypothetical protein
MVIGASLGLVRMDGSIVTVHLVRGARSSAASARQGQPVPLGGGIGVAPLDPGST